MTKIDDQSYNNNIITTYTSELPISMTPVRFEVPPVVTIADTETTGFYSLEKGHYLDRDKGGDKLVSVGLVKVEGSHIVDRKEWFINPGRPIPYESTRIHGITDEMVRRMPKFEEVAQDIVQFLGDDPIVIHNSDFDISFLFYELKKSGITLPNYKILDTLEFARTSLPLGKSASLDSLMGYLGISHIDRTQHGALKDALATALVFLAFRNSALALPPLPQPEPVNASYRPIRTFMLDNNIKPIAERFTETLERKRIQQVQTPASASPESPPAM